MGIFPMAEHRNDPDVFWVDPQQRGILPLNGFHVSRSLKKRLQKSPFSISFNQDFVGVVEGCADRADTWINETIYCLYKQLHETGMAHSIEVWDQNDLVGGVYGVTCGAAFFGESMFSRRTDASKIALTYLVDHLKTCGFSLFDTQFVTPHLLTLGAEEISRASYHSKLALAIDDTHADFRSGPVSDVQGVIQRMIQTS